MRKKTGTIDDLGDGRFRVRVTKRGKRETLGIYDSAAEAESVRAAALEIMSDELGEGVTFGEYGAKWLETREVEGLVRDPDTDWSRWRLHVQDTPIARVTISLLRRRHIKRWLADVQRKGLARQTVMNTLNIIRGVCRAAVDEEILRVSPVEGIIVPRQKRTEDSWTFLTTDEQARAIEAVPGPESAIVQFAIATGLRAGELVCLRVADLGEDSFVVRFGSPPDNPTKAGKVRRVPILPMARQALDRWDVKLRSRNGIVFPTLAKGVFRDPAHVVRWDTWAPVSEAIGRNVRWHDLRHTCAASLLRGWWGRRWSLEEVCAMLGHASITTTERYAHLADDLLGEAAAATRIGLESVQAAEAALKKTLVIPRRATLEDRTPDLRFTKSLVTPIDSHSYATKDQLATTILRLIAAGDPRALSLAVDLAERVLAEAAEEGSIATGRVPS